MTWAARLALAACALAAGGARAASDDGLHPYAGLLYSYDDNLFRLPDNSPGYDNTRADTSRQLVAGLSFNQAYGREVLTAQAKVSRVTFSHFTQLDYNGKDLSADLAWHLGNRLSGNLGGAYSEVLAPYTDVVTSERNLRTQKRAYAQGNWSFHPSWVARAGYNRNRYVYDLSSQAYNDRTDNQFETGVDYLASSGSTIGLQARSLRSSYDVPRLLGRQLIDNDSRQRELKLKVGWRVTPVTELQFLGGWAHRTHAYLTERDSSGANARLSGNTLLGGAVRANASLWREFAPVESGLVSYSLNTGVSAGASWLLSAKLQLDAQTRHEKRAFKGLLADSAGFDLSDRSHYNSLGLSYTPWRQVQLTASLFRESRGGVAFINNGNYRAQGVSLNLNAQY
ncbi:hypothetical protein D0T24_25610 [Duganella sp. BJB480]|nr:hypothetical protein D0T26_24265 [Duganella sp. BJB489]RFP30766.1 hypothetical protein D0T24_25610 [Duganella sp. BJB480]